MSRKKNTTYELANPYGDDKVVSNCAIFGMLNLEGRSFSGGIVVEALKNMRVRGNGLGAGFAAYGIYPKYADLYAFHVMYTDYEAKRKVESLLDKFFEIVLEEKIPTEPCRFDNPPLLWRYFLKPKPSLKDPDEIVIQLVMLINEKVGGAYVFSSGKNMGIFKGTGYPEDIAAFYRLEDYRGYMWLAHSRFPTNSPGWWGGAHPFGILDWAVVHNGEISSYGANRRFLEMYGYRCTLRTDTEVIAYELDLLIRKHGLPIGIACTTLSPPLWRDIDRMKGNEASLYSTIRRVYAPLKLSGPFAIIFSRHGEMVGLRDRLGLRPLVAALHKDIFYLSSEEGAIRWVQPDLEVVWRPRGGEPVLGKVGKGIGVELKVMG